MYEKTKSDCAVERTSGNYGQGVAEVAIPSDSRSTTFPSNSYLARRFTEAGGGAGG